MAFSLHFCDLLVKVQVIVDPPFLLQETVTLLPGFTAVTVVTPPKKVQESVKPLAFWTALFGFLPLFGFAPACCANRVASGESAASDMAAARTIDRRFVE
jgi:hypothetical protein